MCNYAELPWQWEDRDTKTENVKQPREPDFKNMGTSRSGCFYGLSTDFCFIIFIRRSPKIVKRDYRLRHVCPSTRNNSAPIGRIFTKFYIWVFFENPSRKPKLNQKRTRIMEYFTWRPVYIYGSIWLNSSYNEKYLTEFAGKIKTQFYIQ